MGILFISHSSRSNDRAIQIDAAHIVADGHEEFGRPVVRNGIALSKVHHATFDTNLIGIDPDGRVHVSERLLDMHDGPMLEQGLKAFAGRTMRPPCTPSMAAFS